MGKSAYCNDSFCPNACEDNLYPLSVTSSIWPTYEYLEQIFNAYIARAPPSMRHSLLQHVQGPSFH